MSAFHPMHRYFGARKIDTKLKLYFNLKSYFNLVSYNILSNMCMSFFMFYTNCRKSFTSAIRYLSTEQASLIACVVGVAACWLSYMPACSDIK